MHTHAPAGGDFSEALRLLRQEREAAEINLQVCGGEGVEVLSGVGGWMVADLLNVAALRLSI